MCMLNCAEKVHMRNNICNFAEICKNAQEPRILITLARYDNEDNENE